MNDMDDVIDVEASDTPGLWDVKMFTYDGDQSVVLSQHRSLVDAAKAAAEVIHVLETWRGSL